MFELQYIIRGFPVKGKLVEIIPYGKGHIHDTYLVTTLHGSISNRYILQKINTSIFRRPDQVMSNIEKVTNHMHNKIKKINNNMPTKQCLTIIPTHIDTNYIKDMQSNYWRLYGFIDGKTYQTVTSEVQAYAAANAFGEFQKYFLDFDSSELFQTIPEFHNTPHYLQTLKEAINNDHHNRVTNVKTEIDFILKREHICYTLIESYTKGELMLRVTHNDTKINNIIFDNNNEALCVVDLDTVMPGLVHYDFGDMVRTYTSPVSEDEKNISTIEMRMPIYKALAKGYMDRMKDILTPKEIGLLPFSGKLLTLETAIRFLTDYLSGDTYYKTDYPEHNATRCRSQLALLTSIEKHFAEMHEYIFTLI